MAGKRTLAEVVTTGPQFARSVNVERDTASGELDGYLPTARALETTRRVAAAMTNRDLTRAWSVTGPYGSGKSSLALLLDALCGPSTDPRRKRALSLLSEVDPATADVVRAALKVTAPESGFVRATVTSQREPAARTMVRAAAAGLERFDASPRRRGPLLRTAARLLDADVSARTAADFLTDVCELAPVLLILDEFGKNLEFFAETGGGADLFVLQEVAERAAGNDGLPLFLLTLQHLAFEDYASGASISHRREWAKVQGRFEDIPYTDAPTELLELIARVFRVSDDRFAKRIARWAGEAHHEVTELGLGDLLRSDSLLADCYPLHALTLAVLPELCSRYGQRERTLFSFLARLEPNSVPSFLEDTPVRSGDLETVGLDRTYDYFVGSAGTILGTADGASRWLEVDSRIRETQGLTADEVRCLKAVGVLNLVSRGGALRASTGMVKAALPSVDTTAVIRGLEDRGIVAYRAFADEYRIWQGSDFDLQGAVDEARRRLIGQPLAGLCERALPLGPLVAARHSQESGVLRFFARAYLDASSHVGSPSLDADEDGLLAYVVDGTEAKDLSAGLSDGSKPVLLVYPSDATQLKQAAADAAAVTEVLQTAEALDRDWVARRELHERASLATERFRTVLADAFDIHGGAVVRSSDGARIPIEENRTWSAVLSAVCDSVFTAAPVLRSEMLARRALSSQAARARRDLLTAMVQNQGQAKLGIEGYGPERAMLESVLLHTGLYRQHGDAWTFGAPPKSSDMAPAWRAMNGLLSGARHHHVGLDAIWAALKAPPFGLPEGPIPVLVTAALLASADDLALYQDGTFQALISVELLERVIKSPDRFTVKHFATTGQRSKVLSAVAASMEITLRQGGRRNAPLLAVLTPILSTIRSLPEYTRRTASLSDRTTDVRRCLLGATEPDELLFKELPQALGHQAFSPTGSISEGRAEAFAADLANAVQELRDSYPTLLDGVRASLADGLGVRLPATLTEVRANLGSMARRLVDGVIEPRLRSFLIAAGDEQLEDLEWIEYLAMNVAEKPASAWRDEDHRRFDAVLDELLGAVRRVNVLHFGRLDAPDATSVARQVTVTTPEGVTSAAVIWLDDVATASLADVVEQAVAEAARRLGRRGTEALLALLADEMLSGHGVTPLSYDSIEEVDENRRRRNG